MTQKKLQTEALLRVLSTDMVETVAVWVVNRRKELENRDGKAANRESKHQKYHREETGKGKSHNQSVWTFKSKGKRRKEANQLITGHGNMASKLRKMDGGCQCRERQENPQYIKEEGQGKESEALFGGLDITLRVNGKEERRV